MKPRDLQRSARVSFDLTGEWAWSFWCAAEKTADEVALQAKFDNNQIRESTVGRLRAAGFDPVSDSDRTDHCQVRLTGPPSEADCAILSSAFDEARPRP